MVYFVQTGWRIRYPGVDPKAIENLHIGCGRAGCRPRTLRAKARGDRSPNLSSARPSKAVMRLRIAGPYFNSPFRWPSTELCPDDVHQQWARLDVAPPSTRDGAPGNAVKGTCAIKSHRCFHLVQVASFARFICPPRALSGALPASIWSFHLPLALGLPSDSRHGASRRSCVAQHSGALVDHTPSLGCSGCALLHCPPFANSSVSSRASVQLPAYVDEVWRASAKVGWPGSDQVKASFISPRPDASMRRFLGAHVTLRLTLETSTVLRGNTKNETTQGRVTLWRRRAVANRRRSWSPGGDVQMPSGGQKLAVSSLRPSRR